jgi:uncharacterized Ntn-hydrolase superfamily protein
VTFSLVCREPSSGALAVATATGIPAVGGFVPHLRAGAGAIATQGFSTNRYYGADGLDLLAAGRSARDVVEALSERDRGRDWRQCLIVDAQGRTAAYTGSSNQPVIAVRFGEQAVFGGNMLAGEAVIDAMAAAFAGATAADLVDRLLAALREGERAGGDKRGACSAALLVEQADGQRLDLRIDDHPDPIGALKQLAGRMREPQMQAFLARLPTLNDPHRA